jgi:hypothetical protein
LKQYLSFIIGSASKKKLKKFPQLFLFMQLQLINCIKCTI